MIPTTDILIIGAGAAGLMAARELTHAGKKVIILEARSRLGGRIHTQETLGFSVPTEAGAEFVHGDLPVTRALCQEAGILLQPMGGQSYQVVDEEVRAGEAFIPDFAVLLQKLNELPADLPFADFLTQYLPEAEYAGLREAVTRFAEGYDAADITRASTFALRDEWQIDGALNSYWPRGGYSQLINFLADAITAAGGSMHVATVVNQINWQPGQVEVIATDGREFVARQVLITVPLGVLQAAPNAPGAIRFRPDLLKQKQAWQALGFGAVIKVILEFKSAFWEEGETARVARKMPDLGFLFAAASPITAWWTHLPDPTPLLTGWLAGRAAVAQQNRSEEELITLALTTLANLFETNVSFLREQLMAQQVINWVTDPFARGAYAYATVAAGANRQVAAAPVQDTLFFAGEALYAGPAMGTVEAALASGQATAREMVRPSV